ncbi:hypothetical protein [Persicirhabdus sediminis]|uniref:Uncharacterized protein n=1 Tax=Persicirhabdus sediminis TaxID=454144 RepID=A0A8J7SHC8_9BACT|nr:hypothetical protein [Persicirhabdus sediminis]MBK1789761.1 hypothetical protein [Persicirhabdus sediminis]
MYFIKYNPLKQQLRDRSLSEREALPYYLLLCALSSLMCSLPSFGVFNWWNALSCLVALCVTIGGVIYSFSCNGGSQGIDFIQKSVVLGWVVFVRCFLAFMPLAIAIYIILAILEHSSENTSLVDVIIANLFGIIFYQRLGVHLCDIKNEQANNVMHNLSEKAADIVE